MDIHAPNAPIHSKRDAAIHLVIVTIGILIALSCEGLLEWAHHRSLVREARANISTEIQSNKKDLEHLIGEMDAMRKNLEHGISVIDGVHAHKRPAEDAAPLFGAAGGSVIHGYDLVELGSASKTTAEITGAFALMDYAEVKKYATAYTRQELYNNAQDAAWNNARAAFALGQSLNVVTASTTELEDVKRQLRLAIGDLILEQEIAVALTKAYDRVLPDSK